jgi:Tfp pilus assembly protein PilF
MNIMTNTIRAALPGLVLLGLALLSAGCSTQLTRAGSDGAGLSQQAAATRFPAVTAQTRAAFERANRAIANEDWHEALYELHTLVEDQPDLSGPYLNLALVHRRQGDPELAEQFFRKTIEINPANLAAHNQYGIFLREQGRFREAETSYLQALAVFEGHPDTHRNIGVLYDLYMGDQPRALHHFNRYQQLTGASDKVVSGWIVDLQRQLPSLAQGGHSP